MAANSTGLEYKQTKDLDQIKIRVTKFSRKYGISFGSLPNHENHKTFTTGTQSIFASQWAYNYILGVVE